MKIVLIFLLGFILPMQAFSESVANFCMRFESHNSSLENEISRATCSVNQVLKWGDRSTLWKCKFNNSDSIKVLMSEATTIGYDYDLRLAYSIYGVSPKTQLGKFLIENLSLSNVVVGGSFKVYYRDVGPVSSDSIVFLKTSESAYELYIDLDYAYGNCE